MRNGSVAVGLECGKLVDCFSSTSLGEARRRRHLEMTVNSSIYNYDKDLP